jgi:hypothetical protein
MDEIGPALPPHLLKKRKNHEQDDHISHERDNDREASSPKRPDRKAPIGPYIPPNLHSLIEQNQLPNQEEEEDSYLVGPMPSNLPKEVTVISCAHLKDIQNNDRSWKSTRDWLEKRKLKKELLVHWIEKMVRISLSRERIGCSYRRLHKERLVILLETTGNPDIITN